MKKLLKNKLLIRFGLLSLTILIGGSLVGVAQPVFERYPTAAELQRLREKLRQQIRAIENSGNVGNGGNTSERQRRESFIGAWSRIDRAVAPFLGEWTGYEEGLAVYPSNRRGRVCLIYIAPREIELSFGNVSNGQIRTNEGEVIIKEGDFLGVARVINNRADIPVEVPYSSPTVLRSARDYAGDSATSTQEIEKVVGQFNAAGCTANLPSKR